VASRCGQRAKEQQPLKQRRKKKNKVRDKDWEIDPDNAYSHDLKRHRKTNTQLSDNAHKPDIPEDFVPNGVVVSHSKKWAFVQVDSDVETCRISDWIIEDEGTVIAPGDRVLVDHSEEEPVVMAIAPRTSKLSRMAIEQSRVNEQVFAANVDVLVVVAAAAKPDFKPGLVDRYLIAAEAGGVQPVLCVNKMDLVDAPPESLTPYEELGIPVVLTSCETRIGLDELCELLYDKSSVFAGHSGVGKSSILNALEPALDIDTREVSIYNDKGKHTTTQGRLYELDHNIRIIDTPGIRQLGLWQIGPEEISYYFSEIAEAGEGCKFRDCTHIHEPKCAVKEAIEEGRVSKARYDSYLRIRESLLESR
jgi:ribosome biogenesis GTPase